MRGILIVCLFLGGCGGSLSDEQRNAMKEELEMREIKKISQEQIFERALELGRSLVPQLQYYSVDSVAKINGVKIFLADIFSSETLSMPHNKILEAYIYALDKRDISDNVQNSGDIIIYSAPVIQNGQLQGVWFIDIPQKKIVLTL